MAHYGNPSGQPLRWATAPSAPRAPIIPQERWLEYKDVLDEMYQALSLDVLITTMEVKHKFKAT
jgi:hypothetical protein